MSLPKFKLLRAQSVDQAVEYLGKHSIGVGENSPPAPPQLRIIAGGTDLIPSMRQKLFEPEYVLDVRGIATMRGIKPQRDGRCRDRSLDHIAHG